MDKGSGTGLLSTKFHTVHQLALGGFCSIKKKFPLEYVYMRPGIVDGGLISSIDKFFSFQMVQICFNGLYSLRCISTCEACFSLCDGTKASLGIAQEVCLT